MQCDFKEGMKIPKGGFVQGGQLLVPLVDEDEDEDEAGAQLQRKLAGLNVSEITNAGPTWYKGTTVPNANVVLVQGLCWQDTMFGTAMREDWRTRDGGLMKVRDVVGLVMLRFETKQPPDSNGWLYSDTSRLTIMDDRTVAERGEDRTFKLMSWIGTSGPTYLTQ